MKISRIRIRMVLPNRGLVGFVSLVVDDWLYLGNIAIFTRLDRDGDIRLVFPNKKIKDGFMAVEKEPEADEDDGEKKEQINLFYPLTRDKYFELERAVQKKFNELS